VAISLLSPGRFFRDCDEVLLLVEESSDFKFVTLVPSDLSGIATSFTPPPNERKKFVPIPFGGGGRGSGNIGFMQRTEVLHEDSQEVAHLQTVLVVHEDRRVALPVGDEDLRH